jgi:hypothetical protein
MYQPESRTRQLKQSNARKLSVPSAGPFADMPLQRVELSRLLTRADGAILYGPGERAARFDPKLPPDRQRYGGGPFARNDRFFHDRIILA